MNEKERQELDLEEILKEFGNHPEAEAVEEAPQQATPEAVTGDTVRLDDIQKAVAQRLPKNEMVSDDTQVLPDLSGERWEPEYDEPVEQYAPIAFKPKSRLQQLRAKLVAGPEKRYYDISELGFGKLQIGMLLTFLIFVAATGSTVLYQLGMVSPQRLKLLVFIQLLSMLLAALLGCYRLLEGLGDLLHLRFTLDTLLVCTFAVCCVDGILCLGDQRISCSAVFCLQMLLAQWGAYQRRSRELSQMDTLRRATELEALVKVPDYHNGKPGFVATSGEPEAFMDTYHRAGTPELVLRWFAFVALLASLGLGTYAGVTGGGLSGGTQVCAGALLLSMPATAFIAISRPEGLLQKRLSKLGTVLCGWQGIRQVKKKNVFPVTHEDLFPVGSVKLNGVKYYGSFVPDTVVCFAASLMAENGGCLDPLLRQLLAGRNGELRPVQDFGSFDGGVSGVIDGTPVSLGTPEFTKRLGVELETRVPQGVCLCIDGQLAGLFAVTFSRSKSANAGLRTLWGYRRLEQLLISRDFLLTKEFLAQYFRGNSSRLGMPELEIRKALQEKELPEEAAVIALMTKPGLAPKAFALTGARSLKSVWRLGVGIHLCGGILGLAVAFLLVYCGALHLLTPVNLLLYGLIWMVPGFLVTHWTRWI